MYNQVMVRKVSSNYDFFVKTSTSKYKGEWLAIADKKIIAHGKKADEVYKAASKKTKSKNISLAKAPNAQMLVLSFRL